MKCIAISPFNRYINNFDVKSNSGLSRRHNDGVSKVFKGGNVMKSYISWNEYFMGIALLSGKRSKDPQTQVGACLVNADNRIVGIGYNGLPRGCQDDVFPWEREGSFLETKYPYVVHAEQNAILNATAPLKGCRLYVSLFPCHECAKYIIQSGITDIYYMSDKYQGTESNIASKRMLDAAGVRYEQTKTIEVNIETSPQ